MAIKVAVLAAGQGTRMNTTRPKVLHEVAGRPMVNWLIEEATPPTATTPVVVLGDLADQVASSLPDGVDTCIQTPQLGTGHALQIALEYWGDVDGDTIVVLPGDMPLIRGETVERLVAHHSATGAMATVLTAHVDDATGYGRILRDSEGNVKKVVEHGDASEEQRRIGEINSSVYVFDGNSVATALKTVDRDNRQGEYYLPDVIAFLVERGDVVSSMEVSADELAGVNSQSQLAWANTLMRRRINEAWMAEGVWMADPDRTYVDATVELRSGVRLYPGVYLEGKTLIGTGTEIGPDVFVRDTEIGRDSRVRYAVVIESAIGNKVDVGPYVSLRPGTRLSDGSKAGTFVEMKKSVVGEGSKVPHLTYLGDADVGKGVNVGAGTITVNYDGVGKYKTTIKDGAFVGSDTMLIAPVTIGENASTGAGSVITKDVSDGALGIERSPQKEIPGYAARREERKRRLAEDS